MLAYPGFLIWTAADLIPATELSLFSAAAGGVPESQPLVKSPRECVDDIATDDAEPADSAEWFEDGAAENVPVGSGVLEDGSVPEECALLDDLLDDAYTDGETAEHFESSRFFDSSSGAEPVSLGSPFASGLFRYLRKSRTRKLLMECAIIGVHMELVCTRR